MWKHKVSVKKCRSPLVRRTGQQEEWFLLIFDRTRTRRKTHKWWKHTLHLLSPPAVRQNLRTDGILWKLFASSFAHTHTDALVEIPLMGQKANKEEVFSESRPLALVVLAISLFQIDISKSKCNQIPIWCYPMIIIGTDTIWCPGEGCLKSISVTMKRKVGGSMFSSEWATSITGVHNLAWKWESEEKRIFLQFEPSIIGVRLENEKVREK